MAHKKGGSSSHNGRDSEWSAPGCQAVCRSIRFGRQHFNSPTRFQDQTRFKCDAGKDDTLFATADGVVMFDVVRGRKRVNVMPAAKE